MKTYKIDWFSFSFNLEERGRELEDDLDEELINLLRFDLSEFQECPGRYFYNSGLTIDNMVNIYYNTRKKAVFANSTQTMTIVFTGKGTDILAERWGGDWLAIFSLLREYGTKHFVWKHWKRNSKNEFDEDIRWISEEKYLEGVEGKTVVQNLERKMLENAKFFGKRNAINYTRLDLALDDFDGDIKIDDIVKKLEKGHYFSSKKSFSIQNSTDRDGNKLGETIYIGNPRVDKENMYLRIYSKLLEQIAKGYEIGNFPIQVQKHFEETKNVVWNRYEISFSGNRTNKIIKDFLDGYTIDRIFKTTLRNLLELLTPRSKEKNKSRWYKTRWWEQFLEYDEKMEFETKNPDPMFAEVLQWIRASVLPSISVLEKIGQERGFDIYEVLRQAKKIDIDKFSQKQNRVFQNSKTLSDETINQCLANFIKKEEDY